MVRSLALAAFLLLTLLWTVTALAEPESVAASFLVTDKTPVAADLAITTGTTVTDANVITVTTTTDELNSDGDCSLREAIQAAATDSVTDSCPAGSGGDTVYLPAGHYVLLYGQIVLTSTVRLQGGFSDTTILDGDYRNRVLYIAPQAMVTLRNLEIQNGSTWDDPFCYPCPLEGGGILNLGTVWIAYSTIHGNNAGTYYSGVDTHFNGADGGGIYNEGILTVTNSTISNNAAGMEYCHSHGCGQPGDGGGIANYGTLLLDHATVANNSRNTGAGVYSRGTTTIKNSIIANNNSNDCNGTITALGNNLFHNTVDCIVEGNFIRWRAYLNPLADNGGPTPTQSLNSRSPAIDAGDCTDSMGITVTVDQRGEPRPQGDGCDIGAYESPYTSTFTLHDTKLPLILR